MPWLFNGYQRIQHGADTAHDIDIGALIPAPYIVGLSNASTLDNGVECAGVVFDKQPVTNVVALAVNRQADPIKRIENGQRDELFGEMVRPIIVGAVGHHHRQPIGARPCLGR